MGGIFLQPLRDWSAVENSDTEIWTPTTILFSNKNNALHQVNSFYC